MSTKLKNGKCLTSCPHCGFDEFFTKAVFSGKGEINYEFNGGRNADNTNMHDSVNYTESKTIWCTNCRKKLGTLEQ